MRKPVIRQSITRQSVIRQSIIRQSMMVLWLMGLLLLAGCSSKSADKGDADEAEQENSEAKAMLQGIWVDEETDEVSFRAEGDTIYYPDSVSQPTRFRIVGDSLVLKDVEARYAIVRQSEHVFWFRNQTGDEIHLNKSDDSLRMAAFTHQRPATILTYTEVVKTDSVVFCNGERYHWYLAINPTHYKVHATSYSDDGVEVDQIYYDNIMHVSLFQGSRKVFSSDFRKQQYEGKVPHDFLEHAILTRMEYAGADNRGFRFNATLCIPDGASCYRVENLITPEGRLVTKLLEN